MKTAVITIYDCSNYGNRLQNYAVNHFLNTYATEAVNININIKLRDKRNIIRRTKNPVKKVIKAILPKSLLLTIVEKTTKMILQKKEGNYSMNLHNVI